MKLTYAIDFGTSNSILGAADEKKLHGFAPLDPGASDPAVLRTLLYFPNMKEVFYGSRAIEEFIAREHTGRFIRSIKRQLPIRSFVNTYVDNRPISLEDLIASFLGEVRRRANTHFNEDVTRVVLGRPARFAMNDDDDRFAEDRLRKAAELAGFKDIEFFPEPVAAAVGYDEKNTSGKEKLILAADYGGGTSDFTIYKIRAHEFRTSDVLGIGGLSVAGDALDAALMRKRFSRHFGTGVQYKVPFGNNILTMPNSLMERICHPGEISLLRKQDTMEFLRNVKQWSLGAEDQQKIDRLFVLLEDQLGFPFFEKIEKTKRDLSSSDVAKFEFSYPTIEITEDLTREQFERYTSGAIEQISASLDETLQKAGIKPEQIDRVLCTGGTGKVPVIRKTLTDRFGKEKLFDLDPFRGVATGLMKRAQELS